MNINELIVIVQKKNDLNRRRRRFYYRMGTKYAKNVFAARNKPLSHKEKLFFVSGYVKAQIAMKKMTKRMCKARKEIGAKFHWNDCGMIAAVSCGDLYIPHAEYNRRINAHQAEKYLLGSK